MADSHPETGLRPMRVLAARAGPLLPDPLPGRGREKLMRGRSGAGPHRYHGRRVSARPRRARGCLTNPCRMVPCFDEDAASASSAARCVKRRARLPIHSMAVLALLSGFLVAGCGGSAQRRAGGGIFSFAEDLASSRKADPEPRFRPPPTGVLVRNAIPVDGMVCRSSYPVARVAHVELFAADRVVVIPAGIGVAPPLSRHGAYVRGGRCVYPLRTVEPTGLMLEGPGRTRTLGELFALWGQRLNRHEVAGFRAKIGQHVSVFSDGVRWQGNPAAVPLSSKEQITIEVGPYVPPHVRYVFPSPGAIGLIGRFQSIVSARVVAVGGASRSLRAGSSS